MIYYRYNSVGCLYKVTSKMTWTVVIDHVELYQEKEKNFVRKGRSTIVIEVRQRGSVKNKGESVY